MCKVHVEQQKKKQHTYTRHGLDKGTSSKNGPGKNTLIPTQLELERKILRTTIVTNKSTVSCMDRNKSEHTKKAAA